MAAAPRTPPVDGTPVATAALARLLEAKGVQGYAVESQTDTEATLVIKGRKRWFRNSVDHRQHVAFDEHGAVTFTKVDAA
jgi:hypothetical protein